MHIAGETTALHDLIGASVRGPREVNAPGASVYIYIYIYNAYIYIYIYMDVCIYIYVYIYSLLRVGGRIGVEHGAAQSFHHLYEEFTRLAETRLAQNTFNHI